MSVAATEEWNEGQEQEQETVEDLKKKGAKWVSLYKIQPNDYNPNEMDPDEFELLLDNIKQIGFAGAVLVCPHKSKDNPDIKYIIVDGEHRFHAALALGMKKILVIVKKMDEATRMKKTVRMNKIKGTINPRKFYNLVEALTKTGHMQIEEAAFELGFADETELEHMLALIRKELPAGARKEFDSKVKEAHTVDDIYALVMKLFKKYGDTLPANFMILAFSKKRNLWIKLDGRLYKDFEKKARVCLEEGYTFDSVIVELMKQADIPAFIAKHKKDLMEISNEVQDIDDFLLEEPEDDE